MNKLIKILTEKKEFIEKNYKPLNTFYTGYVVTEVTPEETENEFKDLLQLLFKNGWHLDRETFFEIGLGHFYDTFYKTLNRRLNLEGLQIVAIDKYGEYPTISIGIEMKTGEINHLEPQMEMKQPNTGGTKKRSRKRMKSTKKKRHIKKRRYTKKMKSTKKKRHIKKRRYTKKRR